MKRILFVDDEPMILDGLRRMLHAARRQWDARFAESGPAALALLAAEPHDVVVSDMRMPGMNGAQLLAEVKRRHPDVIRVILSGHAETSAVMQAFGVSQQYLTKPCEQQVLRETIDRAIALQDRLANDAVRAVVGGIDALPSLPGVYRELVACLQSDDASLGDVSRIIGGDPGMTASLLKVVNSAYFSLPRPLTTIDRAVAFLGLETVMALTLDHGLFGSREAVPLPGFNLDRLRRDSLATAAVARALARQDHATEHLADEAFVAGLLHDTGRLVLASGMPERYAQVIALVESAGLAWHEAELQVLHTTHAEVGAYLLGLWGFPNPIVEAVLFHQAPGQAPTREWGLPGLLSVSSALASHPDATDPDDPRLGLEPGYADSLGLRQRWPAWREASGAVLAGRALP